MFRWRNIRHSWKTPKKVHKFYIVSTQDMTTKVCLFFWKRTSQIRQSFDGRMKEEIWRKNEATFLLFNFQDVITLRFQDSQNC